MILLRERNHPANRPGHEAVLGFDDARSIADELKIMPLFLAAVVISHLGRRRRGLGLVAPRP